MGVRYAKDTFDRTINRSKDIYSSRKTMSDNTEQVEQITKAPSYTPKKGKDPKRVAAGMKLAESNKIMREEHARYKASEEARRISEAQRASETPEPRETETETNDSSLSDGLLSQLSLTNVISLVGIGLTIYAIFFKEGRAKEKHVAQRDESWQEPVNTNFESTEAKPQPQPKPVVKPKTNPGTKPRPRFGM